MNKIPLTPIQRRIYDRIVELTENGKHDHVGTLGMRTMPTSTVSHFVGLLAMHGLIRSIPEGTTRRLTLLVGPEGVETVDARQITALRLGGRSLREEKSPRDDGKFSQAFEAAFSGKSYPSMKMKRDVLFKGQHRPDARAV